MNDFDKRKVEDGVRLLLEGIGADTQTEGLKDTPSRMVRAWEEMTSGYRQNPATLFEVEFSEENYDQMIMLSDVPFSSTCEHHLLPFTGVAHVGYIPSNGNVCGLSKLARLIDIYARRLQLQERMTQQVLTAMVKHLKPKGAGIIVQAAHQCMACRGVQKPGAKMTTCALDGVIKHDPLSRTEFMRHMQ